jgi:head-tail adaptor
MKQHYDPCELDQPVIVITKTPTPDGAGGFTETEAQSAPHLAKVRPLRGQERLANEQVGSFAEALFVFHRDIPITNTSVLLYEGQRYNVTLVNPPGRSAFIEVEATRGGGTP